VTISVPEAETLESEAPARRTIELGLLVLADVVISALYVLASVGAKGVLPAKLWLFLAAIFGLTYAMHRMVLRFAPQSNQLLLPLAAFLNGIGYVEISRWNPIRAQYQSVWILASAIALGLCLKFVTRIRNLDRFRYLTLLSAISLMLLPLVPVIGIQVNGARLWVGLGPVSFQPVEIAKILLAIFFASYFAANKELLTTSTRALGRRNIVDPRILMPIVVTWGIALMVLGVENDIGFAMLLFALFLSLLWVATGRVAYVISGLGLLILGGLVASQIFYQVHQRVSIWLDPWNAHAFEHGGRQILAGWFSLSAGGLTGTGVGLGQAGRWVSEVSSDMILTAIGEELGLVGVVFLLSALLLIITQGFKIAQQSSSDFARLTAVGLSCILGFQTFFICAGVLRVLPLTGITLPFVAYGGSSLVANYLIIALLLRISHENAQKVSGGRVRTDLFVS
jgi:cell division protein FtsW (lipid II flippase)